MNLGSKIRPTNAASVYKKLNLLSLVLIILVNFTLLLWPYIPNITYYVNGLISDPNNISTNYNIELPDSIHSEININLTGESTIPVQNILYIPKIGVDSEILESESNQALEQGLWRRPHTSTPDKGSNTVIVAHRFLYSSGSKTFYHLDKLEVGDIIISFWEGEQYTYIVNKVHEVSPTDTFIENSTKEDTLTLYTCSPLYIWNKRLVVSAKLVENG